MHDLTHQTVGGSGPKAQASSESRRRETQLNEAQALAHVGSWEWDIANDTITWSDELYRIYGIPSDTRVDFQRFLNSIHPDDREFVNHVVETAHRTHQPFEFEHRVQRPDGSVRVLNGRGRVVVDEDGKPVRMYGTGQDITDRKDAEEKLRESEQRYRSVTQSAQDGIVSVDSRGRIMSWNRGAQAIFGYNEEEMVGQPLTVLMPEASRDAHQRGLERVSSSGAPYARVLEVVGVRRDGTTFPMELSISAWRTRTETCFTAILRDITAHKMSEENLRRAKEAAEGANQAKTAFLSAMSHELRTPLNAIIGFSELLINNPGQPLSDTEVKSFAGHIHRSGLQLLHLINDILDITRLETGRIELKKQFFLLEDALVSCVTSLQPMIQDRLVRVNVPNLPELAVYADPVRFRQVLINLLSNAVKFSAEDGEVRVEAEQIEGNLHISVEDDGIGIPAEEQERIFEPFQQLPQGETQVDGTGLGLAITRQLVHAHGGRLTLQSTPGKGSRFTVVLPQPKQPSEPPSPLRHSDLTTE